MFGAIELIRCAAADAARAEDLYADASFRAELREGKDAFRSFTVTTLPSADGRARREIQKSWGLRIDPHVLRPLL